MSRKHTVELTDDERRRCAELVGSGTARARSIMHAQVLLKADASAGGPGWTDRTISEAFSVSTVAVSRIRKTMVNEGLELALTHYRTPHREYQHKLDGHGEAHLLALACSEPPEGHARWSLRLLSHRMVELGYVDSLCHETVGQVLKKTTCSPGAPCASVYRPERTPSS